MQNENVKDTINGHAKPIPKKKMMMICIITLCVLLAVLIGIVIWQATTTAPALTNLNKVVVSDCLDSNQSITIPIKVKKVYYNPFRQKFNSDLSIEQLCEKATTNDSNVKYKINNNIAYIYKEVDGKILARAALHNKSASNDYQYVLENMYVEGIVFPTHLTEKIVEDNITLSGIEYYTYAVSFMTIDKLYTWLSTIEKYSVEINNQRDTITCSYTINNTQCKTQIYFNGNLIALKQIENK